MDATFQVGDVLLVGIKAQAFLSRAIKLGSILRYQPRVARVATVTQAVPTVLAVVLGVVLGWGLLGTLAAVGVSLTVGVALVWTVAAVGGDKAAYWSRFSHAALVTQVDTDGTVWLSEALAAGVVVREMHYASDNYTHIPTNVSKADQTQVQDYAASVVAAKGGYGRFEFFGLFIYCVTSSFTFMPTIVMSRAGTAICSGFVCDALTRAGYIWKYPPFWMMPADIASHFGVQ